MLRSLWETWDSVTDANLLECWHDANHARAEAVTLFASGVLDLRGRARADELYRACCKQVLDRVRKLEEIAPPSQSERARELTKRAEKSEQ